MKQVIRWIRIEKKNEQFTINKESPAFTEVVHRLEEGGVSSKYIVLEMKDIQAEAAFKAVEQMRTQESSEQTHLGLLLLSAFLA